VCIGGGGGLLEIMLPQFKKKGGAVEIISLINGLSGFCVCGLVVRVPGYRSRGPGSFPSDTRFSDQ
jgi:hypothetical protein